MVRRRTFLTHAFVLGVLTVVGIESAHAQQHRRISSRDSKFELEAASLTIPMQLSVEHPIVEVMLGDSGPFRFVVDSAAGASVLDASLTKSLSLQVIGEARVGDASTETPGSAPLVLIPEVRLGTATARDVMAVSVDLQEFFGNEPGHPDGILGFPLFAALLLTFDYDGQAILLEKGELPPPDGKSILPCVCAPTPRIKAKLGQNEIEFVIDTGAAARLVLPKAEQSSTATMKPPRKTRVSKRLQSESLTESARLRDDLTIGHHTAAKPIVDFDGKSALIGSQLLQNFRVTFDQSNARVRFERKSTTPIDAKPLVAAGLATDWAKEGRRVRAVVPDSAASIAGVQAGDVIIAANGKPTEDIDREQWRTLTQTKGALKLAIQRGGDEKLVTLSVDAVVE